jgi:hypothetical protein
VQSIFRAKICGRPYISLSHLSSSPSSGQIQCKVSFVPYLMQFKFC